LAAAAWPAIDQCRFCFVGLLHTFLQIVALSLLPGAVAASFRETVR
jgi:hypothetical protein